MMHTNHRNKKDSTLLHTKKQHATVPTASIDELKKDHKPEYINIYWDEWKQ